MCLTAAPDAQAAEGYIHVVLFCSAKGVNAALEGGLGHGVFFQVSRGKGAPQSRVLLQELPPLSQCCNHLAVDSLQFALQARQLQLKLRLVQVCRRRLLHKRLLARGHAALPARFTHGRQIELGDVVAFAPHA